MGGVGGRKKRDSLLVHLRISTLQVVLDLPHNKFDSLPGNEIKAV